MKENIKKYGLIIFSFGFIVLTCLFWSIQKSGLMIDEIYQHCMSNGVFPPFVGESNSLCGENMIDMVITQDELRSLIDVSPDTRFDFESVYINHAQDVHPPLYAMLVHGIYSLTGGGYSKWIGLILNLVLYMTTLILLYKLCQQMFDSGKIALSVVILYGLSYMGLSTFLMIRMYILLTLFTVLLAYIILQILQTDKKYLYPLLTLTMFAGLFTQYYFVFYAFFICLGADIYFLINRNYKKAAIFSIFALSGVALMYGVYPVCIDHMFTNQLVSGKTAVNNILNISNYGRRIIRFIGGACTGSILGVLIGFVSFFAIIKTGRGGIKKHIKTDKTIWAIMTILPAYISLIISAIVSPYVVTRYIYNLFPVIALTIGYMMWLLNSVYTGRKKSLTKYFIIGLIVLSVISMIKEPGYLYREDKGYNESMSKYSNSPCICICENNNPFVTQNLMQLLQFKSIFVTDNINSDQMIKYINSFVDNGNIVFLVDVNAMSTQGYKPDKAVEDFGRSIGYNTCENLYIRYKNSAAYVLSSNQ